MSFNFCTDPVFGHHQPLTIDYLETRLLTGLEGCYRNRIAEEGCDVGNEVYVALAVQQDVMGQEQGCRVLKAGRVEPSKIN